MILNLLYLGRIDYAEALTLQQRVVELRHQQRIGNTLLLLEHPPVLTLGRNSHRENILATDAELARRGVAVHEINRGGDVTYHGPGQLVGYPIFDLRSFAPRLGVVDFVRLLEEVLIRTCANYGLLAQRVPGRTGVWTLPATSISSPDGGAERKIAAIGVHVSRGITSHGFAFNLTPDLRDFDLIVPCGIADRATTSLELEVDEAVMPTFEQAANEVARQFGRVFEQQVLFLTSLDDLLASQASQPPGLSANPMRSVPAVAATDHTVVVTPMGIPGEELEALRLGPLEREEENLWA